MGNQGRKTKIDDGYRDYVLVPAGEFEPEHWNEEKYKGGGIPGNEDFPENRNPIQGFRCVRNL